MDLKLLKRKFCGKILYWMDTFKNCKTKNYFNELFEKIEELNKKELPSKISNYSLRVDEHNQKTIEFDFETDYGKRHIYIWRNVKDSYFITYSKDKEELYTLNVYKGYIYTLGDTSFTAEEIYYSWLEFSYYIFMQNDEINIAKIFANNNRNVKLQKLFNEGAV